MFGCIRLVSVCWSLDMNVYKCQVKKKLQMKRSVCENQILLFVFCKTILPVEEFVMQERPPILS